MSYVGPVSFSYYKLNPKYHNVFSLKKAKIGAQQWRNAQESLITLENKNVASVDSIVRFAAFLARIFDVGFCLKSI